MFGDVKSSLRDKQDVLQENEELKNQINSLTEQNNILIQDQTELTRLKELYNLDQEYTDYPKLRQGSSPKIQATGTIHL